MKALVVKNKTHIYDVDDILVLTPDSHEFNEHEKTVYKEVLNINVDTDYALHSDERINLIGLDLGIINTKMNRRRKYKYTELNGLENKYAS